MRLSPLKTALVSEKGDVGKWIVAQLEIYKKKNKLNRFPEGSIIAIASKVVSILEGNRTFDVNDLDYDDFIHRVADQVISGERGMYLTLKDGIIIPNAGIDKSNLPAGKVILWPKSSQKSAECIRNAVLKAFKLKRFGVMIVDSRITPGRRGTIGLALAVSGFEGISDKRGKKDLYGKRLKFTTIAVADDLASAASLLMGEGDESCPLCLIEQAPVVFTGKKQSPKRMLMVPKEDLFKF